MKKTLGIIGVMLIAATLITWFFRYEYIEKSARVPGQNIPQITYDVVLRIDRLTGEKCLFEGGLQEVEIYDETLPLSKNPVDTPLYKQYTDAGLCK